MQFWSAKLFFQRSNRIWRIGLVCKASSIASNQTGDITNEFLENAIRFHGLFKDWKLQTEYIKMKKSNTEIW